MDVWLIYFEDRDRAPEIFFDTAAAMERYKQISVSWNAHLFKRVDCNHQEDFGVGR